MISESHKGGGPVLQLGGAMDFFSFKGRHFGKGQSGSKRFSNGYFLKLSENPMDRGVYYRHETRIYFSC